MAGTLARQAGHDPTTMDHPASTARDDTRAEIAALAATLIADSGLDFHAAKRKAAQRIVGDGQAGRFLPDNELVDHYLLEHLHPNRVARYRDAARIWLDRLADFAPHVTGAAWKGIVTRHAPLHLQVFTDDPKDLEIKLLDAGIDYDVGEIAHFARQDVVPALSFWWQRDLPVLISVYRAVDLRGALKRSGSGPGGTERGNAEALRRALAQPEKSAPGASPGHAPSPDSGEAL